MTMWRIVVTENVHGADNVDAFSAERYQNLRLLFVSVGIRVRANHRDHYLAPGIPSP